MFRTLPTAQEVAAHLNWDEDTLPSIEPHLASVTTFVRSYTRGQGFIAQTGANLCQEDIAAVIVSACVRSVTNPEQVTRVEVGNYNAMPAKFEGFTLVEQYVLHGYRRRTA